MIRYYICNLENERDFSADNVTFQRADDYQKNIQILRDKRRDQLTFYATVSDRKLSKPSMLFSGKPATSVNDIMILLSLAQSRNIYYPKAEDVNGAETEMWGMPLGGNRKAWGYRVIMEHEIEGFLNTSLSQIRKSQWLSITGVTPAIFWWLESIYDRPFEIKFISSFIALEVLANSHAKSKSLKSSGVRTRIEGLANSYSWAFMDSLLIKNWTAIRDKYMHTGSTKSLSQMNKQKIIVRYSQLIHSLQIALIDLLGFGNFVQRQSIINQIKRERRETWKDYGPFPIPT